MKALVVGYHNNGDHGDWDCYPFRSAISFLDYDLLILHLGSIISEYRETTPYLGLKSIDENDSAILVSDLVRRKIEIKEFLKLGRTVFVYTPPPIKCYVDTGNREYSGTGRNRTTTRLVEEIDIRSILPIFPETFQAIGTSLEFIGNDVFKPLWNEYKDDLQYSAIYQENVGNPLFRLKGTKKVVSSHVSYEKGNLVFLPYLDNKADSIEVELNFITTLIRIYEKLNQETGDFSLPQWSNEYALPGEEESQKELIDLQKELSLVMDKITAQKDKISKIEENKLIFTSTGRPLELQVSKVFLELGFSVTEGLPGRDDLILKYGDRVAVVEVKGVTKSAAEKHSAQLEKWVSEYFSNTGVNPKGILIVNAFKDTPLIDRNEDSFPNQMHKYSESRSHCLMTSLQLLTLSLFVAANPDQKESVIESIFSTIGVYKSDINWNEIIKFRKIDESVTVVNAKEETP